jgi:hypothetical protein
MPVSVAENWLLLASMSIPQWMRTRIRPGRIICLNASAVTSGAQVMVCGVALSDPKIETIGRGGGGAVPAGACVESGSNQTSKTRGTTFCCAAMSDLESVI